MTHARQQQAEFWAKLNPPARPSAGDIAHYEAILRSASTSASGRLPSCIILGGTPELRSLAHRHGCRVVCVDSDRTMFDAMSSMVDPAGPEDFLHTDWFALSDDRRYDVVLGDGSLNMVPADRHGALLGAMARVLGSGGTAALRVHLQTAPPFASVEEIVTWFRRNHAGKPFFPTIRTPLYMLLMHETASRVIHTGDIRPYLASLHAKGILTDEELGSRPPGSVALHFLRADEFEALASRWFAIERIRYGGDYGFPENHPIYELRRMP